MVEPATSSWRSTDILLDLANRGVDVFRLDAVAFMWKRMGTNCQNQPEVHSLLRALRACARIAAPAVSSRRRRSSGRADLAPYLGVGRNHGRECDLAYHNSLMVQYWSALATRDTRLMNHVLSALSAQAGHDVVGDLHPLPRRHRLGHHRIRRGGRRLDRAGAPRLPFVLLRGRVPGSFARGEVFQHNPANGDSPDQRVVRQPWRVLNARSRPETPAVDLAIARILLGHALIMGWDGLPLLYMGDEIALLNDRSYRNEMDLASDNRWLHRPRMDWERAARRHEGGPVARVFEGTRHLVQVRREMVSLHASVPLELLDLGNPGLFAFVRTHASGPLLAVHNLTETPRNLDGRTLEMVGLDAARDAISAEGPFLPADSIALAAYGVRWLVAVPVT